MDSAKYFIGHGTRFPRDRLPPDDAVLSLLIEDASPLNYRPIVVHTEEYHQDGRPPSCYLASTAGCGQKLTYCYARQVQLCT